MDEIHILPVKGLPEVKAGDDLARLIGDAASFAPGDILVVAQKVVSKAEGRIVALDDVTPSLQAQEWATAWGKDARVIELVLAESARIVRMEKGIIVAETRHGFVCANAGVDVSNAPDGTAILLPLDPDGSARGLHQRLGVAVIVSDTFGRPWREGLVNVALGVAGMPAVLDLRGQTDAGGKPLTATIMALADEIASAAELMMGKSDGVPAVIVRGLRASGTGSGRDLIRPVERDLFR